MAGVLESLIGGGLLGGISSVLSSGINWASQQSTNQMNESLMRESWAREDNAVQRRKDDLIAAGLNPVLAAGSAAQSSSAVRLQAPEWEGNIGADAMKAATQAVNIAQTQAQVDLTEANTRYKNAEASILEAKVPYAADNALSENQYNYNKWVTQALQKDIETQNLTGAQFKGHLNAWKHQHADEFAALDLYMQQAGATKAEWEIEIKKLEKELLEKDLQYYGIKMWSGVASQVAGTLAKVARPY